MELRFKKREFLGGQLLLDIPPFIDLFFSFFSYIYISLSSIPFALFQCERKSERLCIFIGSVYRHTPGYTHPPPPATSTTCPLSSQLIFSLKASNSTVVRVLSLLANLITTIS